MWCKECLFWTLRKSCGCDAFWHVSACLQGVSWTKVVTSRDGCRLLNITIPGRKNPSPLFLWTRKAQAKKHVQVMMMWHWGEGQSCRAEDGQMCQVDMPWLQHEGRRTCKLSKWGRRHPIPAGWLSGVGQSAYHPRPSTSISSASLWPQIEPIQMGCFLFTAIER